MHPTTRDLLQIIKPELERRLRGGNYSTNFHAVSYHQATPFTGGDGEISVELLPACHLIGAAQIVAEYPNGWRAAYSGDIGFHAEPPADLDALVVDASIPSQHQAFCRDDVFNALYDQVRQELLNGKNISLVGHFGILQEALHDLHIHDAVLHSRVYGSERDILTRGVFIQNNFQLPDIFRSDYWREDIHNTSKVFLYGPHNAMPSEGTEDAVFHLNRMGMTTPIQKGTGNVWRVAMSAHSNLESTVEYIAATKASKVVIDTKRGGPTAVSQLLDRLRDLDIDAEPASLSFSPD